MHTTSLHEYVLMSLMVFLLFRERFTEVHQYVSRYTALLVASLVPIPFICIWSLQPWSLMRNTMIISIEHCINGHYLCVQGFRYLCSLVHLNFPNELSTVSRFIPLKFKADSVYCYCPHALSNICLHSKLPTLSSNFH